MSALVLAKKLSACAMRATGSRVGAAGAVIHAFQKKSKTGIKTPKAEIDLIRQRLKRVKEMLQ
jgi:hypothetical protein